MFKENFIKACNLRDVSPSKCCIDIGLSSATFSNWTEKTVPRKATLMKIAEYLDVSVEYLLSEGEVDRGVSKEDKEFIERIHKLSPEERALMLNVLEGIEAKREKK